MSTPYQMEVAEIVQWLEEYEGPRFHAVLCDPPYALISIAKRFGPGQKEAQEGSDGRFRRLSGGFMGQEWDGFESMEHYQQWVATWAELLIEKALHPGAVCLFFGGTRTWHRLACGLEDGGFNIYDTFKWVYGCLDDESEILTSEGWKYGVDLTGDEIIAQWSPDDGSITMAPMKDYLIAPYSGPMIYLENHNTSQLLTPNHRVYWQPRIRSQVNGVRSSTIQDGWSIKFAGTIPRWEVFNLPLAGYHDGVGLASVLGKSLWNKSVAFARLLAWVWTEGGFDKDGTGVRIYQSSVNPGNIERIDRLLASLIPAHKRYERERSYVGRKYTEVTWFFTGEWARLIREILPGKKPTYDLLWQMSQREKVAFWESSMRGDGSFETMQFWQKNEQDRHWFQTLLAMIGKQGMHNFDKDCVSCHNNDKTQIQARHKTESVGYDGLVWCVETNTGAFVARRKGQVFITGNSGFPKSHNISKFIDKQEGDEREVVEERTLNNNRFAVSGSGESQEQFRKFEGNANITAPATEDAEHWDGYGTALKPAWEPVVVARAPRGDHTYADLALKFGTGALNIDGGRISGSWTWGTQTDIRGGKYGENRPSRGDVHARDVESDPDGRWPANFGLVHTDFCVKVAEIEGEGRVLNRYPSKGKGGSFAFYAEDHRGDDYDSEETGSEVREVWACVPGCPVRSLDDQAGVLNSKWSKQKSNTADSMFLGDDASMGDVNSFVGDSGGPSRFFYCAKASKSEKDEGLDGFHYRKVDDGWERINDPADYPDERTISGNIHPTVKPLEICRYLAKLVLPPELDGPRRILVPFAGSGSEMIGARQAEWDEVVGVELSDDFAEIAEARLRAQIGLF